MKVTLELDELSLNTRLILAQETCDPELLAALATDKNELIRQIVAVSSYARDDTLKMLENDECMLVRDHAKYNLARRI